MHDNPCHDRRPVWVMCAGNRVDLRENYEKRHRKYVLSPQPGSYRARIVPENTTTTPTRSSHKEDATLKITRTRTWTLRRVAYSTTENQQQFEGNSSRQLSELSVAGSVDSQFSFSQSVGSKQARADDSRRNSIDSGWDLLWSRTSVVVSSEHIALVWLLVLSSVVVPHFSFYIPLRLRHDSQSQFCAFLSCTTLGRQECFCNNNHHHIL